MHNTLEHTFYQIKALFGFYRPTPLLAAHISASVIGGFFLDHLQRYWGDFFLSYALSLTTILWALETIFTVWNSLQERTFSPGELARSCSKWLLWVTILFVAYSIVVLDPILGLIGKTMQMAVLLTQSLYVVRGAAKLLNNPLADQLVLAFQGSIERRIQALVKELSVTREQADQAQTEALQLRAVTEDLQADKAVFEERLTRLELEVSHGPTQ
jgi:hypothetical protein